MGGNTESVLKPGIKFRLATGSLRRHQEATHTSDCSGTKNRLSRFLVGLNHDLAVDIPRPPGTKP